MTIINQEKTDAGAYYIKAGYHPKERALTFEGDDVGAYWTDERIKKATTNQYYVYEKCFTLLQNRGYHTLLDVGCGPPVKIKGLLAQYCVDIVLVDQPSIADLVNGILPKAEFIPVNLEHIDLVLPKKFDLIICADVLEHLLNPDNCVRFIRRHLAPQGLAVLSTPERDYLRGKDCSYSPKPEHVREWNSVEFAQYITSRGFEIVEHSWLPQLMLGRVEFFCSQLLPRFVWGRLQALSRRWGSCQVLACRSA